MNKFPIAVFLCLTIASVCNAQDVYDKMAKQICKCLEKSQAVSKEEASSCVEKALVNNVEKITEYHHVKSAGEVDPDQISIELYGRLMKNCRYLYELLSDSIKSGEKTFEPDSVVNCDGIQVGDYYYVMEDSLGNLTDTTYATFTEKEYYERMNHGKTYSRLKVEWMNPCKFKLIFIESNDPYKRSISKPGDEYVYEVIQHKPDRLVLKYKWMDDDYYLEFIKVKY